MVLVILVIALGIAVGLGIDVILTRRQRARRVVFDPPGLPEGFIERRSDHEPTPRDDEGITIIGPVVHDDPGPGSWEVGDDAEFDAGPQIDEPGRGEGDHGELR